MSDFFSVYFLQVVYLANFPIGTFLVSAFYAFLLNFQEGQKDIFFLWNT